MITPSLQRIPLSLCLATLLTLAGAQAQVPSATSSKAPAKKPAATTTESAKPRQKLLTLDQLRRCMKLDASNASEGAALRQEKIEVEAERAKLMEERAALQSLSESLAADAKAIVAEQDALVESSKELAKPVDKSALKEAEAKRLAHNALVDSNRKRVEGFNAQRTQVNSTRGDLDTRIAASNVRLKKFQDRADEHNYNVEDWKADCADRPYAEADEIIVKKEMAR